LSIVREKKSKKYLTRNFRKKLNIIKKKKSKTEEIQGDNKWAYSIFHTKFEKSAKKFFRFRYGSLTRIKHLKIDISNPNFLKS
jgi:hypothetical protein